MTSVAAVAPEPEKARDADGYLEVDESDYVPMSSQVPDSIVPVTRRSADRVAAPASERAPDSSAEVDPKDWLALRPPLPAGAKKQPPRPAPPPVPPPARKPMVSRPPAYEPPPEGSALLRPSSDEVADSGVLSPASRKAPDPWATPSMAPPPPLGPSVAPAQSERPPAGPKAAGPKAAPAEPSAKAPAEPSAKAPADTSTEASAETSAEAEAETNAEVGTAPENTTALKTVPPADGRGSRRWWVAVPIVFVSVFGITRFFAEPVPVVPTAPTPAATDIPKQSGGGEPVVTPPASTETAPSPTPAESAAPAGSAEPPLAPTSTGDVAAPESPPSTAATQKPNPPPEASAPRVTTPKPSDEHGPKPPSTSVTPQPLPGAASNFNRDAAAASLGTALSNAQSCVPAGMSGVARVAVTFAPSGRATQAMVEGPPFAGTPAGGCIAVRARSASVPPFSGGPITVHKSVRF